MDIFGTSNSIIGPITLLVAGAMFLGGAMLRKLLNDTFNIRFSVIGCTALGSIAYIIASNLMAIKWALIIGVGGWITGGFIFSFIAGESEGGEEYGSGGNYEE